MMDFVIKSKYELGDKVKVVDAGLSYSTYESWAKKHEVTGFNYGDCVRKNDTGVISAMGLNGGGVLCAIKRDDNREFLISQNGIELE